MKIEATEKYFKIITLILSVILSLFIAEIFLRFIRPERMRVATYEDIYTKTFSKTKNGEVISLLPNISRERWGTTITINSYGERDKEYKQSKDKGVYRIAIIGDSVAFGYGVALEATFAKQLEKKLNASLDKGSFSKYEVLLFGRPGYSISNVYFAYKDKVQYFDPDLVIYAMVLNDFEDSYLDNLNNKVENRKDERFTLKRIFKLLNRSFFSFFRRHSAVYNLLIDFVYHLSVKTGMVDVNEGTALDCLYPYSDKFKIKWEATKKWLMLLKETFEKDNKKFVLCIFPYQFQLDQSVLKYYKSKGLDIPENNLLQIQDMVDNFCNDNGIVILDLSKKFEKSEPKNLFLKNDYGHPNEAGHMLTAETIYEFLLDEKILLK